MPIAIDTSKQYDIKEVWQDNLEESFQEIRSIIQRYMYIAMDTEFPGVVAKPMGDFATSADYSYAVLRTNVDLLKIIQVGLTFYDEDGKPPERDSTYQFNFQFDIDKDMHAEDSIVLLRKSGINFGELKRRGIAVSDFAELFCTSGLLLSENVSWIAFASGYDFGYLLKMVNTQEKLPDNDADFQALLRMFFPRIYDIKYLMKSCKNLKGGLQELANDLCIERVGPQHQAGSDSKLTGEAFFKMKDQYFENHIDDSKYLNHLHNFGNYHNPPNHIYQNGGLINGYVNNGNLTNGLIPHAASVSANLGSGTVSYMLPSVSSTSSLTQSTGGGVSSSSGIIPVPGPSISSHFNAPSRSSGSPSNLFVPGTSSSAVITGSGLMIRSGTPSSSVVSTSNVITTSSNNSTLSQQQKSTTTKTDSNTTSHHTNSNNSNDVTLTKTTSSNSSDDSSGNVTLTSATATNSFNTNHGSSPIEANKESTPSSLASSDNVVNVSSSSSNAAVRESSPAVGTLLSTTTNSSGGESKSTLPIGENTTTSGNGSDGPTTSNLMNNHSSSSERQQSLSGSVSPSTKSNEGDNIS